MAKVEHFPISQFTFTQKFNPMETIWDELTVDDKKLESPKWHEEVLMDREVAMKASKVSVFDWEEAKTRLRRNVVCYT